MKVSIIMAAYNRGYIVAQAIESVLAQTFQDFELIVVDDGSKDDTAQVVSRFDDVRLLYIHHEVNKGCFATCNTGLRAAQGQYVAFLDSDDLWKPGKLAKDVDFLERHPEIDAVFTDLEKQDGQRIVPSFMRESPFMVSLLSQHPSAREIVFTQREMNLCLLQEVPVKPSAFTMRRAVLEKLELFDESWPSGADWEFLLRFSKQFRFGYIDEPLSVLRVQSDATHRLHAVSDKSRVLKMLRAEAVNARDTQIRHAANAGYRDSVLHLSWEYLKRDQRLNAASVLTRGFFATKDPGLLARAAFALVRPSSKNQPH